MITNKNVKQSVNQSNVLSKHYSTTNVQHPTHKVDHSLYSIDYNFNQVADDEESHNGIYRQDTSHFEEIGSAKSSMSEQEENDDDKNDYLRPEAQHLDAPASFGKS